MQAYNLTRESWLATELKPATTFLKRFIGLLGRAGLAPTEGLWIKPCDSIHTLGMRFTIDVIFLDRQGRTVKIVEPLRPGRLIFPVAAAVSVLELPAGTIARTGTQVGDMISITEAPGVTAEARPKQGEKGREKGARSFLCFSRSHSPTLPLPHLAIRRSTMKKQRFLAIVFILSLAASSSGCTNRFVAGVRKLFVKPATVSAKYTVAGIRKLLDRSRTDSEVSAQTEQAYQEAKPVVTIEDSAGDPASDPASDSSEAKADNSPDASADHAGPDDVITSAQAAQYRELLVTKPYDAIVRYNIGRLDLQQGLLEEATYEFDMATSLDPKFTYAFILLGRTLRMRGQYDLAIAKFNVAANLQPDLALTYIDRGVCWDQRGFHDKARDAYLKALSLTPSDGRIYNNIGYSFFLEGDYGAAISAYRKALQLNPDDAQTNNNIALAYAMQQKWDKALTHFAQALGEAAAQNNIGHLLMRAGKVDEAVAHLELAVRLQPDSLRALGNLESALRLKGRIDDAEKLHGRLLEAERTHARARFASSAANQHPQ